MTSDGYSLDPGTIYDNLDAAMKAASCLCGLHPNGATVYGAHDEALTSKRTGEAYVVACECVRSDGTTWPVPDEQAWHPVYTITRALRELGPGDRCPNCGCSAENAQILRRQQTAAKRVPR